MPSRQTTAQKGLDWGRHRYTADALKRNHIDGTPCDRCGRPMYRDRTRNYDYNPESANPASGSLSADHSGASRAECLRRGIPIPPPDRLLHGLCNSERGEGHNDHLVVGTPPTESYVLPWPWAG